MGRIEGFVESASRDAEESNSSRSSAQILLVSPHLETNDARSGESVLPVKFDDKPQVVVDVRRPDYRSYAIRRAHETERIASVVHGNRSAVGHLADHLRGYFQCAACYSGRVC